MKANNVIRGIQKIAEKSSAKCVYFSWVTGGGRGGIFPRNFINLTNLKRVVKGMHPHTFPLVAFQPPQIPLPG
jgi:hypothetical protein